MKKKNMYKGLDIYEWIKTTQVARYKSGKMTQYEEDLLENLFGYNISEFGNRKHIRKVEVFNPDGVSLGIYDSPSRVSQISKEKFGVFLSRSSIRGVCNGDYKQLKGYTFQYADTKSEPA